MFDAGFLITKLILNLYLQSLAEYFSQNAVLVQHSPTSQHFYYPWSQQGTAEKKRQTSAKRHDDFIVIRKQSGGNSADFALYLCVLGVSSDEADDAATRTIVSKEQNSFARFA